MADGNFDLSLIMRADSSQAVAAGNEIAATADKVASADKQAASASATATTASQKAATAQADGAKAAQDAATATIGKATASATAERAATAQAAAEARLAAAQASADNTAAAAALTALKLAQAQEQVANGHGAADIAATRAAQAEAALAAAQSNAEKSAAAAALAALRLQQAQDAGTASTNALERELASLRATVDPAGEAQRRFAQATDLAQTAVARGIITQDQAAAHLERLRKELDGNTKAAGSNAYAIRNVGQQFGDFGLQVASGQDVARSFGQQAGQLGYALSEMGGKLGKVGAFLVGPWGIALTIASAFVAPLIEKLFEAGSAAQDSLDKFEKAATAADSFGTAQSLLGKVMDLTTGKIKTQNAVLIESIRLQALALGAKAKADESAANKTLGSYGQNVDVAGIGLGNGVIAGAATALGIGTAQSSTELLNLAKSLQAGTIGIKDAVDQLGKLDKAGKTAGRSLDDLQLSFIKLGTAKNDAKASQEIIDALDGKGLSSDLKPYEKPKKPKKPKSTAAVDEFGRDATDKIANLVGQFNDTPDVIQKTNVKIRELDDLIDDLGRKKPPGFQAIIAAAEQAKTVVRDGLIKEVAKAFEEPKTLGEKAGAAIKQLDDVIADLSKNKPPNFEKLIADARTAEDVIRNGLQKPYNDFIKSQADGLAVAKLTAEGRDDEAAALQQIQKLESTGLRLTSDQKDAVLATVQAVKAEQRELQIRNELNQKYLTAIGSIKSIVEDATQAFVRGDLGQFIKTPGKLLDAFETLKGQQLFDKLFDGAFRELQDQVNGTSTVKDASDRMAAAVDKVSEQTNKTTDALTSLANAASAAAGAVAGGSPTGSIAQGAASFTSGGYTFPTSGLPTFNADGTTTPNVDTSGGTGGDIVVTGKRPTASSSADIFGQSIGKIATSITGVFTNKESAGKIGSAIGSVAGKGFAGAATGTLVSGIAKTFGIKLNSTGSQIGGAVGSFLPIPGGQIIGSIVGGLIGNLFGTTKKASATLGAVDGKAGVTSVTGNNDGYKATASAAGGAVASSINTIISTLGASLGSFAVSIGEKKGKYVVDNSGKGSTAYGKANDGITAYKTLDEAQYAALQNAIADGAVAGLSAAVTKALKSSTDIDKAVTEALAVKNLETLLGGAKGAIEAIFDTEQTTANERLRLAKAYGLDVAAVEKLNAQERSDLVDSTLKSRLGNLSDFLDSLKFGDLAEGSASDKLAALQVEIDKAQKDAEAGKDGAADTLATLLNQKVTLARDAYGTAGSEYTGARSDSITAVEKVIQMETDRINAAAGITTATAATTAAQTAALTTANTLADEGNALAAVTNSKLDTLIAAVSGGGAAATSNLASVSRSSVLA